jgi:disulfide bond formation protein DsbB
MRFSVRAGFGLMALSSAGLVVAGLVLGGWLKLQPCPLCIFQRLLYLVVAFLALGGALLPGWHRLWGALVGLAAAGGLATAAYQSWLQFAPTVANECGFGEPTLIEQLVDWLGMQWPDMFMATGFCSSKEWVFLGLSMANWSIFCFAGFVAAAALLALQRSR